MNRDVNKSRLLKRWKRSLLWKCSTTKRNWLTHQQVFWSCDKLSLNNQNCSQPPKNNLSIKKPNVRVWTTWLKTTYLPKKSFVHKLRLTARMTFRYPRLTLITFWARTRSTRTYNFLHRRWWKIQTSCSISSRSRNWVSRTNNNRKELVRCKSALRVKTA